MVRRLSKRAAEKVHFKNAVKSRFGLELNRQDINEIIRRIKTGEETVIQRPSLRLSWYLLTLSKDGSEPVLAIVLYDRHRRMLVTAVTEKMWREKGYNL